MICHYCYFNHGLRFQDSVCNGCYDSIIVCLNLSDIAIITVKKVDYCSIINNIIKSGEIILLRNSVLDDRG